MFLGHFAVGLAARRAYPQVSLATWFASVQLADLLWPILLLAGIEHVRIAPGITAFTPLDFYDYPITHSLSGMTLWGMTFAAAWLVSRRLTGKRLTWMTAAALGLGVISHWFLDVLVHRPDMPVLPQGPFVGVGLWHSIRATLLVELTVFIAGLLLYVRGNPRVITRMSLWLLIGVLLVAYFGAAFGPVPPDTWTVAISALAMWLLIPWAWFIDRHAVAPPRR
jgi:hypothetical protein